MAHPAIRPVPLRALPGPGPFIRGPARRPHAVFFVPPDHEEQDEKRRRGQREGRRVYYRGIGTGKPGRSGFEIGLLFLYVSAQVSKANKDIIMLL